MNNTRRERIGFPPTHPPYGYVIKGFKNIRIGQNLLWQEGDALHIWDCDG